jgi:hypothetical protein
VRLSAHAKGARIEFKTIADFAVAWSPFSDGANDKEIHFTLQKLNAKPVAGARCDQG